MGGTAGAAVAEKQKVAVDSSALVALSREKVTARGLLDQLRRHGTTIVVPAPVLAETIFGGHRDAAIHRVLRMLDDEVPTSPDAARVAGAMVGAYQRRTDRVVDAMIIATAIEHGATAVMTQDASDFEALAPDNFTVLPI